MLKADTSATDFYIAKLGMTNGTIEVLTELFNNQLGVRLGFEMAHSGLAKLDGQLYFVTKGFRKPTETLVHCSLIIEKVFGEVGATEAVRPKDEQKFYSVDMIRDVLFQFCGTSGERIFAELVKMLTFDALIGSMDRHAQNWGILVDNSEPPNFRFAPIFDSARALFWDIPDGRLEKYDSKHAIERYVNRARPCIGRIQPTGAGNCNHFGLIKELMGLRPEVTRGAIRRLPDGPAVFHDLLMEFPFSRFSPLRKRLIADVLYMRAPQLRAISGEEANAET